MEKQSDALIILFVQLITGIASVFTNWWPRVEAVVLEQSCFLWALQAFDLRFALQLRVFGSVSADYISGVSEIISVWDTVNMSSTTALLGSFKILSNA